MVHNHAGPRKWPVTPLALLSWGAPGGGGLVNGQLQHDSRRMRARGHRPVPSANENTKRVGREAGDDDVIPDARYEVRVEGDLRRNALPVEQSFGRFVESKNNVHEEPLGDE